MDIAGADLTADINLSWFPLVLRPRPPALPLDARIGELRTLAETTGHDLVQAAEVLNKAALIASDCGLSDLARTLCWRQYEIFNRARPLASSVVKLALQPILNLPRQLIRDGDADRAHTLLETLYCTARDQTDVVIDGRTVRLHDLAQEPDGHRTVCTQVWAALLADGTRALTTNGRWREAAACTAAHRGVGRRLLDGRQVAVLALLHDGEHDQATTMVEQSTIIEPWEQAVQSLLQTLCRPQQNVPAMLASTQTLLEQPDPWSARFHTRLGLLALDLADDLPDHLQAVITAATTDAHAAQDALSHPIVRAHADDQQLAIMARTVRAAGLGTGAIPEQLRHEFLKAVSTAEGSLSRTLAARTDAGS